MSSEKREGSLAEAFGVDPDELRSGVGETTPPPSTPRTSSAPSLPSTSSPPAAAQPSRPAPPEQPVEVSPGIVLIGGHEYVVREDGHYEPASNRVQLNFRVTAKEKHLLEQLAYEERRTLVSYLREALSSRGLI